MTAHVSRISTTALKGTALAHPERVLLTPGGVETNRRFHLVDAAGRLVNGKMLGELARLRTAYAADAGALTVEVPDGPTVAGTVALTDEHVETNFYGRPVPGTIVDGPWGSAISEFTGRQLRLVQTEVPGAGVDVYPVTIISRASLESLRSAAGGPARRWDDRFRMLFEVDGPAAFEEDTWEGQLLNVGEAVVRVARKVPRCSVTSDDPATGRKNFDTLVALRGAGRHIDGKLMFGVYATVEQPGDVWLGAAVVPVR